MYPAKRYRNILSWGSSSLNAAKRPAESPLYAVGADVDDEEDELPSVWPLPENAPLPEPEAWRLSAFSMPLMWYAGAWMIVTGIQRWCYARSVRPLYLIDLCASFQEDKSRPTKLCLHKCAFLETKAWSNYKSSCGLHCTNAVCLSNISSCVDITLQEIDVRVLLGQSLIHRRDHTTRSTPKWPR